MNLIIMIILEIHPPIKYLLFFFQYRPFPRRVGKDQKPNFYLLYYVVVSFFGGGGVGVEKEPNLIHLDGTKNLTNKPQGGQSSDSTSDQQHCRTDQTHVSKVQKVGHHTRGM